MVGKLERTERLEDVLDARDGRDRRDGREGTRRQDGGTDSTDGRSINIFFFFLESIQASSADL